MITYTLYSDDNPSGLVISKVSDESTAHVIESYYRRIYPIGDERFRVTKRLYRSRIETQVTGSRPAD